MDIEEFSHKFAEMFAEVMKPIMQKPLIETREERIKQEFAPVVGDCGWYIAVEKDAAGQLVMKAPATVKRVMGDMVWLEHENGHGIGWTNTKCKIIGDGYSDFFYNMSGYWRCMTMDFATAEDIEKAFPGRKYVEAETDAARKIVPEDTYANRAEMRIRALRRRPKEAFETRYKCQAVQFDELTRIGTMLMRETKRENSKPKYEPFIIGCDMAQGESVTGQIKLSRADGMEVRDG